MTGGRALGQCSGKTREVMSWIIMLNIHRGAETATQKCALQYARANPTQHNAPG